MKTTHVFISGIFLCGLLILPLQTEAQVSANEEAYRAVLIELIQALQKQISSLQVEIKSQQPVTVTPAKETTSSFSDSVDVVAKYNIKKVADVSSISKREHSDYFERVFEIFPDEYDQLVIQMMVFDGEKAEFDAFVETVPPKHESWLYAVNEDIIRNEDSAPNTELIVHELAHIISYREIIDVPKPSIDKCDAYFDIHGCPAANSYLKRFANYFWSTSDLDRAIQFSETPDPFDEVYKYYIQHEDKYVSDYAATSLEEDFAESFMFFVLKEPVKRGTTARQKVDFFNQYSELVRVKDDILDSL